MADGLSGFLAGPEYLALPHDPIPWVIKGLIPTGGMANLYGHAKTGKSFAALGAALAVAGGGDTWLGFDVVKHGRVAYLQIDTPRSLWTERLNIIANSGYSLDNIFFADSLITPYPFNVLMPETTTWLTEKLQQLNPILVVIDVLREIHNANENDATEMKNVITSLVGCTGQAAVLLVSHSRKGQPMMPDDLMGDGRGSNYLAGRMDSVMKLSRRHLAYSGRSVEEGSCKVQWDVETHLPQIDADAEKIELTLQRVLKEAKMGDSLHALAVRANLLLGGSGWDGTHPETGLKAKKGLISVKQAGRRMKKFYRKQDDAEDEDLLLAA